MGGALWRGGPPIGFVPLRTHCLGDLYNGASSDEPFQSAAGTTIRLFSSIMVRRVAMRSGGVGVLGPSFEDAGGEVLGVGGVDEMLADQPG